jgi:hypothetical protein
MDAAEGAEDTRFILPRPTRTVTINGGYGAQRYDIKAMSPARAIDSGGWKARRKRHQADRATA